jgi:hypothetical protein
MTDNLNLANQMIVNAENQSFVMGEFGLWGKKVNNDGSVDPNQIRITNNIIAMTDDNWTTLKLAIGVINGKTSILADVIAGKLLAGNDLYITNENKTFRIDYDGIRFDQTNAGNTFNFHVGGDGVTIRNGSIVLENAKNKILLDPVNGFKMQKYENSAWVNKLYADTNGNLILNGIINTTSGTIGGFNIGSSALSSTNTKVTLNASGEIAVQSNGVNISLDALTSQPLLYCGNTSGELFSILHNGGETLFSGTSGDMILNCPNGNITLMASTGISLNSNLVYLGTTTSNTIVNGSFYVNNKQVIPIYVKDIYGTIYIALGYPQ